MHLMLHKNEFKNKLKSKYYNKMENNFNIEKVINNFIKNNVGSFKLHDNSLIKFRYEYLFNNRNNNIFIYLNNWNQLINLYKIFPKSKRHFYEIIDNKCKFFLDLDAKMQDIDINEWNNSIIHIKEETKKMFKKIFNKNISIIEYQSYPSENESKYSCHLIVTNYCFYADECKLLCNMLLNVLHNINKNIIDDKVYGHRRMLRIEGSTKVNSSRIKICVDKNNKDVLRIDGLITNLENTVYLSTKLFNLNKSVDIKNIKFININNFDSIRKNNKKYNYTNNDILFIKNNFKYIIIKINSIHDDKVNVFILDYILNNMIILKRTKPCFCFDCKRIHENQHPYMFMNNNKLFFHCRRSQKPVNVSYLL